MFKTLISLFKKVFTFKNVFSCFISAIGYGFGFYIPYYAGCSYGISFVICLLVGSVFDYIASKMVNSDIFKNDRRPNLKLGMIIYFIYLLFWFICYFTLGHDLDNDLFISFEFMIAIQVLGFVLNLLFTYIKKRYGKKHYY